MKVILIASFSAILLMTVTIISLFATGYIGAAIGLSVFIVLLFLGLLVLGTSVITTNRNRELIRQSMLDGANIVLKAVRENDQADARKIGALGALLREGAKVGRQSSPQPIGLLPPPSEDNSWLDNEIEEFETIDYVQ